MRHPDEKHIPPFVFVEIEERLKNIDNQEDPFSGRIHGVPLKAVFYGMGIRNIKRCEEETKGETP